MRLWIVVWIFLFSSVAFSEQPKEPSLQEATEQALHYARLEARTIKDWEKNVRKAPFVPRLQFGFERRVHNSVDVNVEDSVAVNSSGITVGPAQSKQAQNADNNLNFEVKAVWFLDQLLFSREHLDISQEARYLAYERERIFDEVRKSLFQRQRGLKALALLEKSKAPSLEREIKELEITEATAALDNLTGGWFSAQVRKTP